MNNENKCRKIKINVAEKKINVSKNFMSFLSNLKKDKRDKQEKNINIEYTLCSCA